MIIYIVVHTRLVDLSDDKGRFLQLEHEEKIKISHPNSMGFLPNGDLVIVLRDYKIYSYSVDNKPTTNTTLWKCSQIYDIEITKSLKVDEICCFVYQTKLFFLSKQLMIQWNLLEMTFDMQYLFDQFEFDTNHQINILYTIILEFTKKVLHIKSHFQ